MRRSTIPPEEYCAATSRPTPSRPTSRCSSAASTGRSTTFPSSTWTSTSASSISATTTGRWTTVHGPISLSGGPVVSDSRTARHWRCCPSRSKLNEVHSPSCPGRGIRTPEAHFWTASFQGQCGYRFAIPGRVGRRRVPIRQDEALRRRNRPLSPRSRATFLLVLYMIL